MFVREKKIVFINIVMYSYFSKSVESVAIIFIFKDYFSSDSMHLAVQVKWLSDLLIFAIFKNGQIGAD